MTMQQNEEDLTKSKIHTWLKLSKLIPIFMADLSLNKHKISSKTIMIRLIIQQQKKMV